MYWNISDPKRQNNKMRIINHGEFLTKYVLGTNKTDENNKRQVFVCKTIISDHVKVRFLSLTSKCG